MSEELSLSTQTTTQTVPKTGKGSRRSYILGVLNGAFFRTSEAFMHPQTVLTWFLDQLGAANILIAMVNPIRRNSSFLLQLVVSGHLERQPTKQPFYRTISYIRCLVLLALAVAIAVLPLGSPWLLTVFFVIFTAYSVGAGLVMVPFMDIVGKVIPAEQRGSFISQRLLWGGLLGIGASALTGYLLSEPGGLVFPLNVAVVIGLAAIALAAGALMMCLIDEPEGEVHKTIVPWQEQLRRGWRLLRDNPYYRRFALVRLALSPAQWATPFFTVYARRALDIPPAQIGFYLGARTAAALLSNLIWGPLSDRRGNRLLTQLSIGVGLLMPVSALLIGTAGQNAPPDAQRALSYAFAGVFVLLGAYESSRMISYVGYLLDLAPEIERPLYTAFSSTIFGLTNFSAFLSGLIVDAGGHAVLLIISACSYGLALFLSAGLIEPRTDLPT